jgi:hypothetical protein
MARARDTALLTSLVLALLCSAAIAGQAEPVTEEAENPRIVTGLSATAEFGFLAVAAHDIQFSQSGTSFDYVDDGGQDVLFAVSRFSADLQLRNRHTVTLLYQPLRLETSALLSEDLSVDSLVFPAGTAMDFLYDFPFFRISWMYDLLRSERQELGLGLSLQIRNATIVFSSRDGTLYRDNRDIGPVPVLKLRGRYTFKNDVWVGTEIDGFYAPISYLNGSDEEVTGAILDASLRAGIPVLRKHGDLFMNVRYLGGGAVGTSEDDPGPGDGYVENWLHFITVTLGATIRLR